MNCKPEKIRLLVKALSHYAERLEKFAYGSSLIQNQVQFIKTNILNDSCFALALRDYIETNGIFLDIGGGVTIFQSDKIKRTIYDALECYCEGLINSNLIALDQGANLSCENEDTQIDQCTNYLGDLKESYGQ